MFGKRKIGYAATLAWVMLMVVISVAAYLFRTADRWVYYPIEEGE
jgi:ABC-type sugar transport system permease subunit